MPHLAHPTIGHPTARDTVRIRSAPEILATLDADGCLDGLPFMPEMLKWCGKPVRVAARADKTCDTATFTGVRRLTNSVHLDNLRCDGSAHGACQAGCLLFWKESWLQNAAEPPDLATPSVQAVEALGLLSRRGGRYQCQATQMLQATTPLPFWDPRQYIRDISSGNISGYVLIRGLAITSFNRLRMYSRRLPEFLRVHGAQPRSHRSAARTGTPHQILGLKVGELVQVKSQEEIEATLDRQGRNRGLTFEPEMTAYCDQTFLVENRVERIIDETTGQLKVLRIEAIILRGVDCRGLFNRFCPRRNHFYWREIWLRRV